MAQRDDEWIEPDYLRAVPVQDDGWTEPDYLRDVQVEGGMSPGAQDRYDARRQMTESMPPGVRQFSQFTDAMVDGLVPFRDEILAATTNPVAAFRAAVNKDDPRAADYYDTLAAERQKVKVYADDHPVASTVGNITGGIASIPFTGAQRTLLGQAAAAGAEGFVYGAGAGEGGVEDRLKTGAVTGAISAAVPLAMAGGRAVAGGVRNMVSPPTGERALNVAQQQLLQAMRRDGISPTTLGVRARQTMPGSNSGLATKPITLADIAGENTRSRVAAAVNIPSEGADIGATYLRGRREGQVGRIMGDADALSGLQAENRFALVDDISRNMRQRAQPLYDQAYAATDFIDDPVVSRFLDDPSFKSLYDEAVAIHTAERQALRMTGGDKPDLVPLYSPGGQRQVGVAPDLQTMDYVQRALDDRISGLFKAGQGDLAKAYKGVRQALVQRLEAISPEFSAARRVWRGGNEALEAAEDGARFMAMPADELAFRWGQMSADQQEIFRRTSMSKLREMLGRQNDGADVTRRVTGNPDIRTKLQVLFPDQQSFETFMGRMAQEEAMARTETAALVGSRTEPLRQQTAAIQGAPPIDVTDAAGLVTGDWRSLLRSAGSVVGSATQRARAQNPEVADQLVRMGLTEMGGAPGRALNDELITAGDNISRQMANRLGTRRMIAEAAGRIAVAGGREPAAPMPQQPGAVSGQVIGEAMGADPGTVAALGSGAPLSMAQLLKSISGTPSAQRYMAARARDRAMVPWRE